MKFLIIGLGCFGRCLAQELTNAGHEVIGADQNERWVDSIKDKISGAFILDATDNNAIAVLPLNDVDVIIVAVGRDFGASIKIVSLLKNRKVTPPIYARAFDDTHTSVLSALGVNNILHPETDVAFLYAKQFSHK